MEVKELINYIDLAIKNRPHTNAFWIDEKGNDHHADVGYGVEWWEVMKKELIRVFIDIESK